MQSGMWLLFFFIMCFLSNLHYMTKHLFRMLFWQGFDRASLYGWSTALKCAVLSEGFQTPLACVLTVWHGVMLVKSRGGNMCGMSVTSRGEFWIFLLLHFRSCLLNKIALLSPCNPHGWRSKVESWWWKATSPGVQGREGVVTGLPGHCLRCQIKSDASEHGTRMQHG